MRNCVDLKRAPGGAFEAIVRLKDALSLNVELAAPDQFQERGGLSTGELQRLALAVLPDLVRYPSVDADEYQRKIELFIEAHDSDAG